MSNTDTTRMMGATQQMPAGGVGATQQMPAGMGVDALRTQMGGTTLCPICQSTTPVMETYCGDCGFLLTSPPGEGVEVPPEETPAAELVDMEGRRYRLRFGVNTIGRQGTDVIVSEGTVSRIHARIVIDENGLMVEDLGSTNGTKVNETRIGPNQPTPLLPGTPLRFGNWRVTLEVSGAAAAKGNRTVFIGGGDDRTLVGTATGTAGALSAAENAALGGEISGEISGGISGEVVEGGSPVANVVPDGPLLAHLRKKEGPAADIPIFEGVITVGRKTVNTIVLAQDSYISGRHAEIMTDATGTYLTDLDSTNGTFVNGQRLTSHERQLLIDGDEVQLGQSKYIFLLADPDDEAASESDGSAVEAE